MTQYLDYNGLKSVLNKIDVTFERKGSAASVEARLNARIDDVETIIGAPSAGEDEDVVEASGIYADLERIEAKVDKASAKDTTTTADVQVLGGPLANNIAESGDVWPNKWSKDGKKVIPAGTSIQDIVSNLFFAKKWGNPSGPVYAWSPVISAPSSLKVNGVSDTSFPVGTEVTLSYANGSVVSGLNAKATVSGMEYGYSLDGSTKSSTSKSYGVTATGSSEGIATYAETWSGYKDEESGKMYIKPGYQSYSVEVSGITAKAGSFTDVTVYNVANDGSVSGTDMKTISNSAFTDSAAYAGGSKDLSNSASITISGYYPVYCGWVERELTEANITPDFIKSLPASQSIPTSTNMAAGSASFVLALKTTSTKMETADAKGMAAGSVNSFIIDIPNAVDTPSYKVFWLANSTPANNSNTFSITLS